MEQAGPPRKIRRRTFAVGLSALVHLVLLTAFFASHPKSGAGVSGPPEGPGIAVSLVHMPSQTSSAAPASALSELETLRQQLQTSSPPTAPAPSHVAPPTDAAAILAAFDHRPQTDVKPAVSPSPPAKATPARSAPSPTAEPPAQGGGSGSPVYDPFARASFSAPALKTFLASGLFSQVAKCWSPEAPKTIEVRLSVRLDSRGELTAPPQVIGPQASAGDPRRAEAEAAAIRAVIACAPYASAPTSAELDFKAGAAG